MRVSISTWHRFVNVDATLPDKVGGRDVCDDNETSERKIHTVALSCDIVV